MRIPQFAANQNDVFLLALLVVLVATVAVCAPIVFARRVRRFVWVLAAAVAAGCLLVAGWQFGIGVRTLADERSHVRSDVSARFGLSLTEGQVDELINGGSPLVYLPQRAAALGLSAPDRCKTLDFKQRTFKDAKKVTHVVPDTYDLRLGGRALPETGSGAEAAPTCDPKTDRPVSSSADA